MEWGPGEQPEKRRGKGEKKSLSPELSKSLDMGLEAFGIAPDKLKPEPPPPLPKRFTFQNVFDLADGVRGMLPHLDEDRLPQVTLLLNQCDEMLAGLLDKIKDKEKEATISGLDAAIQKQPSGNSPLKQFRTVIDLLEYTRGVVFDALTQETQEGEEKDETERKAEKQQAEDWEEKKDWRSYEKEKKEKEPSRGVITNSGPPKKLPGYMDVANTTEKDPKAAIENVEDPRVPGNADFPHDGKHMPNAKLVRFPENIILKQIQTDSDDGNDAVYKTNVAKIVIQWENRARKYGLLLADNFTIIHKFGFIIGADQGELTTSIRIDGDHGHPISEKSGKQSLLGYLVREFEHVAELAKTDLTAAKARLKILVGYLERIGMDAQGFVSSLPESLRK